ncbi:MAG: M23 family metallopeptidase [Pseudomonadota bacterium]
MRSTTEILLCLMLMLGVVLPVQAADSNPPFELQGEVVQGGLLIGRAPLDVEVMLDGVPVLRSSDGYFLIGFSKDDTQAVELGATQSGQRWTQTLQPAGRTFNVQRIDGLPPAQVSPSEASMDRIRSEAAMTQSARERRDDRSDFSRGFIWPVVGPITGVYGSQRILNGEPRNPHYGIDIAAPVGTPVLAPAAGVITLVHEDMYFSGGTLLLDHGLGLSSAFLHLDTILVEPGQRVEQGEVIAEVGATGRVTGAHLDWRMNLGSTRVDPELLVPPMPDIESQ